MNSRLPLLRSAAACVALAALTVLHAADADATTVRAKFSDATKPGTLKFSFPWADVRITGTDGPEIVVHSSLEQKGKASADADGFRRLDEDVTFEVVEKNNVATISLAGDSPWAAHGAEFVIEVPRNTNLILRTEAGGDVKVSRIDGDIDINSMNGEVSLLDIGSSAIVNTMNGEVTATFRQAPVKPVSITSMNGEVDVRLPVDTKANIRLRSHNGTIRTNFPDGVLQTKTEKLTGPRFSNHATGYAEAAREAAREMARATREAARAMRAAHGSREKDAEESDATAAPAPAPAPVAIESARATGDLPTPPTPAAAPEAPVPAFPAFPSGKSIVGTLNGGGVDIQLSSMNGTITLRQGK